MAMIMDLTSATPACRDPKSMIIADESVRMRA